mgnify:CR=1 FL=1
MKYKVDNAIIMAAGMANRFAPLSYICPKPLLNVKGEILIERQIQQLKNAGIYDIIVVVGYMKEKFFYLADKYNVSIVENPEYMVRNNNSSIFAVKDYLGNSYICSADNYFIKNPFEQEVVGGAYYAAVYSSEKTDEWCLAIDKHDFITGVTIGGNSQWYMIGHVFWTEEFSKKFVRILEEEYPKEETKSKLWEAIYVEHMDELKLRIRRYRREEILEFDSLDELKNFDKRYQQKDALEIIRDIL